MLLVGLNYAPEPTGIAPYTSGLARGLAERGHDVRVITAMPHYPEWRIRGGYGGLRRLERLDGVSVTRLRHYVPSRPTGVRRVASEISFGVRIAAEVWGRPDIVILVSPALLATAIASVRARVLRIPTIIWVQDVYSLGVTETRGRPQTSHTAAGIAFVESAVLRSAQGVAVIHARFRDVVARLGVSESRVEVVRNWTHLASLHEVNRPVVRERLSWRPEELVVLHSGAMGRKQDLDNVISAARLAEERGTPIRFVLVGDGSERSRLENSAIGLSQVTFLDPLPASEFQDALAAADVLLVNEHAGLREMAVPSKLTSYFWSGRPVLAATDAGSVTAGELASSGGGVRIDPGRPDLLVEGVLEILRDPDEARRIGAAGLSYQRAVLSEKPTLDRYAAWIEEIARSPAGRGSVRWIRRTLSGVVLKKNKRRVEQRKRGM